MRILITGVAGFIGFSLASYLCKNKKNKIFGIDNLDNYYSVKLKNLRLKTLKNNKNFYFNKINICNKNIIYSYFKKKKFNVIYHFAAQAGVRNSFINPKKYVDTNIFGMLNILESIKVNSKPPNYFFYASSSSVYGDSKVFPSKENFNSYSKNIYGISKLLNEDMAEFYSKLINIKMVGLRFFTVYGEWGRPDMFLFKIFKSIMNKNFFLLNNFGRHYRDFTYIGDVIKILVKLLRKKNPKRHILFNICSNNPVNIYSVVNYIKKNIKNFKLKKITLNKADVIKTHGDNKKIKQFIKFDDFTNYKKNINNTYDWYVKYKINKIT